MTKPVAEAPSTSVQSTSLTPPTMSWEIPNATFTSFFPSKKDSKLIGESNYMVWAAQMQTAYHIAGLWDIASKDCRPSKDNTLETAIWEKRNLIALGLLQSSLNDDLIALMTHETHVFRIWQMFESQMSQKGSGSILLWFHQLTHSINLGSDISEHITHFQKALQHLMVAGWDIPEHIAACILLSTLPHDPNEADSWDGMVRQIKIDKDSTTSSTINVLLDEKCHCAATNINDQQRQESAMAVLDCNAKSCGKLYYHNCHKKANHIAANCWAPSGGKEGQGPKKKKSNRGTTSKHKSKERA